MKEIRIGLLGLGNIGTGTYKALEMNKEIIEKKVGTKVNITKILEKDIDRQRDITVTPDQFVSDPDDILTNPDIDIVIELLGGIEPAATFMETAMKHGKHVVTANKALLATYGQELFATAQDELRPVMNGIYFDQTPDCLAIVASDGHKLVRNKILNIRSEVPSSFILPKKPASLLKGVLTKQGGDVVIRFDERNAEINYEEGIIICRLIEGRYPNYNSVIPQSNPNQLTVDRMGLLSALRRVQPFSNDSSNLIRFHVENGTLQLDAEDYDFSKTATERMVCDYNGMPLSIGFKGSSFIEVLSNFDCPEVIIQLADPSRAGLVLPSEQPADQDVLMLMMPMLIND